MRRVLTPAIAAVAIAGLSACSQTTGPDGSWRALGIIQPESNRVIDAPDTVVVDQAFQVTVETIGPNGCWSADGLDSTESGRVIELTPWDRHSGADFCTLALGFLPHPLGLALDEVGEWTIRVTGRQFGGADDLATVERTVFVRSPYSSEQPFEVVLAIGEEILVDGIFRLLFFDVSEDSRCAVDVVCVWEGNAEVMVGLTLGTGPTVPFTLNTSLEPGEAEHGSYRVSLLELSPEPRSDAPIDPGNYRARLRIEAVQ